MNPLRTVEATDSTLSYVGITLKTLFEKQARLTPSNIAVEFSDMRLTYSELNTRATTLADVLRNQYRIGLHSKVGMVDYNTVETMIALVAIVKAGAAYVPLSVDDPESRLKILACEIKLDAVICEPQNAYIFESVGVLAIPNSTDMNLKRSFTVSEYSDESPEYVSEPKQTEADLAAVIYTSGSSGVSKGVMVPQSAVCHIIQCFQRSDDARVLSSSSLIWISHLRPVWCTLCSGATLVLCTKQQKTVGLVEFLISANISDVLITPGQLAVIHPSQRALLTTLRILTISGDVIPSQLLENWGPYSASAQMREWPRLIGAYGATELCGGVMDLDFATSALLGVPSYIPRPYATLHVLDDGLNPISDKTEVGDLYVSGRILALGYYDDNLTNEKFRSVCVNNGSPERMFKTGDLARRIV